MGGEQGGTLSIKCGISYMKIQKASLLQILEEPPPDALSGTPIQTKQKAEPQRCHIGIAVSHAQIKLCKSCIHDKVKLFTLCSA